MDKSDETAFIAILSVSTSILLLIIVIWSTESEWGVGSHSFLVPLYILCTIAFVISLIALLYYWNTTTDTVQTNEQQADAMIEQARVFEIQRELLEAQRATEEERIAFIRARQKRQIYEDEHFK